MPQLLSTTISLILGSVLVINGVAVKTDDIIADATTAVNGANLHQIATVLEVYYMDHDEYPEVKGGAELIDLFREEGYIRNRPLDPKIFQYETILGGQDYILEINK
ncbi:MAG: hypothetical protein COV70_02590 [Parcubacteria group bacterium CG11_big_fil_rev_8_21_14_0_20_39_22]|nr:MAG: hypothetical protein COV70_02590 [Parcubacteria group bacterium CG11_big_fil_rev_8_21_14_0_20_39_22]